LMCLVWALVLLAVFASMWTYLQLDRNSLLSKIASTDSGRVTFDSGLAFRVLTWAVVPLLAAFAAEFPDLVNSAVQLVKPPGSGQ
jgi:hypothetical protein